MIDWDKLTLEVVNPEDVMQGKAITYEHLKLAAKKGAIAVLKDFLEKEIRHPKSGIGPDVMVLGRSLQELGFVLERRIKQIETT